MSAFSITPSPALPTRSGRMAGFTLLELIVALAVTAIAVMIGLPAMNGLIAGSRQTAASNDLLSGLHVARSEALRRNANVLVCRTEDGESCAPEDRSKVWAKWIVSTGQGQPLAVGAIHKSLELRVDPDAVSGRIVLTPQGTARDSRNVLESLDTLLAFCSKNPKAAEMVRSVVIRGGRHFKVERGPAPERCPPGAPA